MALQTGILADIGDGYESGFKLCLDSYIYSVSIPKMVLFDLLQVLLHEGPQKRRKDKHLITDRDAMEDTDGMDRLRPNGTPE
ncbi:unnamed protein product [Taenia asiatica]|uniref:Uncharacterized protein n=1 Tax=Taenia asiatica TaxID=60517 RepID=A0A0R3VXU9_TAEAS|nr:unnamed protein product [Taenia asiatica]